MVVPIAEVGYLAGGCHFDGTDWFRNNMPWGFYATVAEAKTDTSLDAGTNTLSGTEVPPNEVWRITVIIGRFVSATISSLYLGVVIDGIIIYILHDTDPVTNLYYPRGVNIAMGPGDNVLMTVGGATALDDAYLRYCGVRMRTDL